MVDMTVAMVDMAAMTVVLEKRPRKTGGCVGIFFQLFDWNRRFAKKKLFSKKLLPPARSKKFGADGDIATSRKAFNQISNKNAVSFGAMITAYGMNGCSRDALSLFAEMELHGVKPNSVTALCVLSACSHGGLIEEGLLFFQKLVKAQVRLSIEHYSCLVDLLSRGGKLDLAMELIKKMSEVQKAGASAWGALLSGCRKSYNGNEGIGEGAISWVLELEPNNSAGYMLASNVYAAGGLWKDVARVRGLVREKQVKVVAGYSMVHVNNKACKFVAGDQNQVFSDEMCLIIEELHDVMKMDKRNEEAIFLSG